VEHDRLSRVSFSEPDGPRSDLNVKVARTRSCFLRRIKSIFSSIDRMNHPNSAKCSCDAKLDQRSSLSRFNHQQVIASIRHSSSESPGVGSPETEIAGRTVIGFNKSLKLRYFLANLAPCPEIARGRAILRQDLNVSPRMGDADGQRRRKNGRT
jgi:hypothetical protein